MKLKHLISAAIAASVVAGCSTQGAGTTPDVTQANLSSNKLEFAVGTANMGLNGTVGLNTVVSFRQASGASAVLADTPTITGPAGFTVPAGAPGLDANTNHISGVPQTFDPSVATNATFTTAGGAFAYGFGPYNSSSTGGSVYVGSPAPYALPFYASSTKQQRFIGGPPAYPYFLDGTYPSAFLGWIQGFTDFAAVPVAGSYTLSVAMYPANAAQTTLTAAASLTNTTPLPAMAAPTFVPNPSHDGSATGTVTVPADARIVETLVYIRNTTQGTWYTVGPFKGNGQTFNYTLPNNLGKTCTANGCAASPNRAPSFLDVNPATGGKDAYQAYAVAYDYPAFEASIPVTTSATPTIAGANGQADITSSANTTGTY